MNLSCQTLFAEMVNEQLYGTLLAELQAYKGEQTMSISSIQSGYNSVTYIQSKEIKDSDNTPTPEAGAQDIPSTTTQSAKNAYTSTKIYQSSLSSDVNSILLKQQEVDENKTQSKLQEIAGQYNVTNLSGNERLALTQDLRDNGLISNDVMMAMVAPLGVNEDMNAKTNYLKTMKDSLEFLSKQGDSRQIEIQKQVVDILEQLDGFSNNNTST